MVADLNQNYTHPKFLTGSAALQGSFNRLTFHELSGDVEFVDANTVVIRDFVYDGDAPDAFFVAGTRGRRVNPHARGTFALPYPPPPPSSPEGSRRRMDFGDPAVPILPAFDGSKVLNYTTTALTVI